MQNEYDSEHNTPLMRVCKKCNECKPLAQFRYKLTRAQAKQQGYAGNHLVTAEGKVCKDCRPKRKPLNRLTTKELITKASSGDVHPFIAQSRIEHIKQTATALKARGSAERWQKVWMGYLKEIMVGLILEIRSAQQALRYSAKTGHTARAEWFKDYVAELQRLKAHLLHDQRINPREPELCQWEEYFDESTAVTLRESFAALPLHSKASLRTLPTMVKYRYIGAPDNKFRRPHRVTPAERLGSA